MSDFLETNGQLALFGMDELVSEELSVKLQRRKVSTKPVSQLISIPYLYLDLSSNHVDLFGNPYWELRSPYREGKPPLNTGPAPREPIHSSLSDILEEAPDSKYYLSATACRGILRRAEERGKELPPQLEAALRVQSGLTSQTRDVPVEAIPIGDYPVAFAANQRDEVRDLHDVAGTLSAQPGMKQQTFVAGFSAGAGASAGSIGYSETVSPTLKGTASGNCMPSVLCLNDQGGSVMDCSEDVTGTLRAQEHGHQPLVFDAHGQDTRYRGPVKCSPTISTSFALNHPLVVNTMFRPKLYENHGIDARYTGPHPVAPTLSARAGTGGNNLPLVEQETPETICIMGPAIDRQPHNGGNGIGYQADIAYTLTATDHHAVFSRQRVDKFAPGDIASTESARQYKDATDLILQAATVGVPMLIRRLTPLECERLQGFPDGWTALPGASDSARYRALGNSVAIPCVEFIMQGIVLTAGYHNLT